MAWGLWGAAFLIVGGVFIRSIQANGLDQLPAFSGPLVVFFAMAVSSLATWLFRKNSSAIAAHLDFAASLFNFIPGVLLTALVIRPESTSQMLFVLISFACSSLVLYLNPGSTETMNSFEEQTTEPEISLLDYASQLRQAEQKESATGEAGDSDKVLVFESVPTPMTTDQSNGKPKQEEPDCDLFHDDSEWVTQKFKRTKSPEGAEVYEGFVKVEWAPGQRSAVVNIPFSPPFSECPEVYCEPDDGCPSRTKVADCRPYGARIELRLPQECGEHNFSYVHILACLNVEEAEKQETISA